MKNFAFEQVKVLRRLKSIFKSWGCSWIRIRIQESQINADANGRPCNKNIILEYIFIPTFLIVLYEKSFHLSLYHSYLLILIPVMDYRA